MGKLSTPELQKIIDCIKTDRRVIIPPMIGYDAGVHLLGDKYLVVSTDPCTGVPNEWFGWLLINYAASDVALFGAKPEFCTINLLGPRPTKPAIFHNLMKQACKAAEELGVAIVRGHTGMYDSLKDMLGVCTVYGTLKPEQLITCGGAKRGDLILCTKPLGYEIITHFSLSHREIAQKIFGQQKQEEFTKLFRMQSCVEEALQLAEVDGVHAMHDATEGGLVAALNELAMASKVGFRVTWEQFPIPKEALALKEHFGLSDDQLLSMSSTGTILGAVSPGAQEKVKETLKKLGLAACFIGEFTEDRNRILIKNREEMAFPRISDDPYTTILAKSTV